MEWTDLLLPVNATYCDGDDGDDTDDGGDGVDGGKDVGGTDDSLDGDDAVSIILDWQRWWWQQCW